MLCLNCESRKIQERTWLCWVKESSCDKNVVLKSAIAKGGAAKVFKSVVTI